MNQQEVAQVISVLKALYQSSDSGSKKQANDWLQDFQRKQPSAWTTCDAILSAPLTELQNEAKLFAAQTLRNKIINDLRDLDSSAVISLRDSLVNYIKNVRTLPQNLITQVCLSLADIAVQSEAWTNPVADITQQFSADPYLVTCLLEFLTVLPEEVFNDRIVISDDVYRRRSNLLLTSQAANIIDIMVRCLQSSNLDPTTHVRVLSCFTSWIKCGELALGTMKNTPLIELAFAALDSTDETIFDTAVDAVCGIIYESRDAVRPLESSGGAGGDPSIIEQDILPRMAIVADKMRSDEAVTKDADEDRIRGYCRIFAEAGEAWLPEIVKKQGVYEKLLTALIDCMRLPHLEVIRMFFNMWGDMATQVLDHACRGQEYIHKAYIPVFEALIDVIIVHLQYPLEYDGFSLPSGGNAGRWTAQERDEFRDFRHEVGDVLKDCVRVVGDETALMHPFRLISAKISESSGSPQQTPWQIVEASLFALRVMGAEVSPNEDKILPKLMDMFSNFPAHPKLRYAATLVIARYTEWTNKHPQYVPFQLGYVSQGFQDHNIAPASALAIKYLAKDCSAHLVPVWKDLLSFYFQAFSTRVLGDLDMLQVTEALAHVISASPPADAAGKVEEFFAPLLKDLSEKLDQGATTTDSEKRAIIELVERMGVLIDYLDIDASSPSMEVLRQAVMTLCPLLLRILGSNAAHPALSESTARVLRTLIMVCSAMVSQMVPSFIETIVVSFQQTGYGVYLWLLRKIIEVYGNGRDGRAITAATATSGGSGSGNYDALIIQAVEKATEIVLQALQDPATVQSHPETIDEYFRTLSMGLSIMPRSIIQMPS
ncbi:Nuclear import receptor, partial [Spiromyces aspiralis]